MVRHIEIGHALAFRPTQFQLFILIMSVEIMDDIGAKAEARA